MHRGLVISTFVVSNPIATISTSIPPCRLQEAVRHPARQVRLGALQPAALLKPPPPPAAAAAACPRRTSASGALSRWVWLLMVVLFVGQQRHRGVPIELFHAALTTKPPPPGDAQPDLAPGAILRFAVSRQGVLDGLPAFRLPPHTAGSNLYAYMVVSPAVGSIRCSPVYAVCCGLNNANGLHCCLEQHSLHHSVLW